MKKTPKKATFQTLDRKLDGITDLVEGLAVSTKNGFDEIKGDIQEFKGEMTDFRKKTELTLFNIDSKLQTVDQRLDAIEKTLGPLVQISSVMQKEIRDLNSRVTKLEHHAGMHKS